MKRLLLPLIMASMLPSVSSAQTFEDDVEVEEIIVTGSRMTDWEPDIVPSVRLIKRADFMIQQIQIINDSRKEEMREEEIYATIASLLEAAKKSNTFSLGTGEETFVPLTQDNYKLPLIEGRDKADTSYTFLLVKAPLAGDAPANQIVTEIRAFIKNAKVFGRSEVKESDELGLSIVRPERYRQDVINLIAADVKATLGAFGDGYRVKLEGMEWPLMWERQGLATMALYIPYKYDIVPAKD